MRRRLGELWIALGVLHFMVILAFSSGPLIAIVKRGYFGGVGSDPTCNAAFWLFYLGAPFVMVGVLLRWVQRRTGVVPESFSWTALICFLMGAFAVPTSGFWLGAALSIYGIVVSRADAAGRSH
jgi:hypothetical protein